MALKIHLLPPPEVKQVLTYAQSYSQHYPAEIWTTNIERLFVANPEPVWLLALQKELENASESTLVELEERVRRVKAEGNFQTAYEQIVRLYPLLQSYIPANSGEIAAWLQTLLTAITLILTNGKTKPKPKPTRRPPKRTRKTRKTKKPRKRKKKPRKKAKTTKQKTPKNPPIAPRGRAWSGG